MSMEQALNFVVESVVDDVFQHGKRLSDRDLASRKAEEESFRRYEAAEWLRKMVGVVGGKDLPAEPSEEEFRLGLRSGIILCNVLNKVQPGAVPKVVEGPSGSDYANVPDGAALSVFQYFENVRNYLVAVEEMGLPTFEASDLEQVGKSARIVNSVLALKAYSDWKQNGGSGSFKYGSGPMKPTSGKHFVRKNSEPFMNFSRSSSATESSLLGDFGLDINEAMASRSLNALVCQILADKKPEEIPVVVESMLCKVMEEFERRLATQLPIKAEVEDSVVSTDRYNARSESGLVDCPEKSLSVSDYVSVCSEKSPRIETEETTTEQVIENDHKPVLDLEEESRGQVMNHQPVEQRASTAQRHEIKVRKHQPVEQRASPAQQHDIKDHGEESRAQIMHEEKLRAQIMHEEKLRAQIMQEEELRAKILHEEELRAKHGEELRAAKIRHEEELRAKHGEELKAAKIRHEEELRAQIMRGEELKAAKSRHEEELRAQIKHGEELKAAKIRHEEELRAQIKQGEELRAQITKQCTQQRVFTDRQCEDIKGLKQTLYTTKSQMQLLQTKYLEDFSNLGKHVNSLTHAASGYRKVLEENRKLYNQIQDLKGNIRVYCRVRPFLPGQANGLNAVSHLDEGSITIANPLKSGKDGKKSFTFNRVFGPLATQAEVFADTQPLVRSVLDGFNVCIFAYGQTGSGKTHTMTGPKELTEEGMGVNFRALNDLFQISKQRKETILYEIRVQMMEIYNEQVRDLLVSDGSIKKLEIRNSSNNGINVPDANLVPVSSPTDVITLMNLGHRNRAVSATAMNDRSSRSHSCLTVHVQGKEMTSGSIIRGSMHLVDLAGSERVDKSEVVGDRLKEAVHINKSLSALGDVISALAMKSTHVPYRNSKLTQLLQDSLGGQAKTMMFVHISPEPDAVTETLSTLKFAERVSSIELGAAKVNKDNSEVKELKEQIANLKAALARKEGDVDSLPSSPDHQTTIKYSASTSSLITRPNSNSAKRQSMDLQDLLPDSPTWPPVASPGSAKEDDKEWASGEWVDKVMVKRHDSSRDENGSEDGFVHPSKVYPENSNESRSRRESRDFDDDELASATSESSEVDAQLQHSGSVNKSRSNHSGPNGSVASKAKKPQAKPGKPEPRSSPSLIPNPSKKQTTNGPSRTRSGPTVDVRRKSMK